MVIDYIGMDGLIHTDYCDTEELVNFISNLIEQGARNITVKNDEDLTSDTVISSNSAR